MTQAKSDLKLPPVWHLGLRTSTFASASRFVRTHISVARSITNNPLLAWDVTPNWTLCMTQKVEESRFLEASEKLSRNCTDMSQTSPEWFLTESWVIPRFFSAYCFLRVWNLVLPLTDKHKPKATENRAVRGIFGSTMEKVTGGGAKLCTRSVIIRTAHQILLINKSRKRRLKRVTQMTEKPGWW